MSNGDSDPPEQLLTTEQAAEWLNIPFNTLVVWRNQKKGPPYVKLGRNVRYRRPDLTQYIEDNVQRH